MEESVIIKLKNYFQHQPVSKAWIFGSRSRMDYRGDSDYDILVSFDENVGLMKYASMVSDLELLLKKGVDLVSETALFPWVKDSVNLDKKLIYEREA
jgi:predicted nucleotidyltransferase